MNNTPPIELSSPERVAAMTAQLLFSIAKSWDFSDSQLCKIFGVTPLKLKSLKRYSAYFTETQMAVAGIIMSIYNDITGLMKEGKNSNHQRSKKWLNETLIDKTPKQMIVEGQLDILHKFVKNLKQSVEEELKKKENNENIEEIL